MMTLDQSLTRYLVNNCPGRTNQALMERFGIGYNTFRKIEAGDPIRRSVAERLESRIRTELVS